MDRPIEELNDHELLIELVKGQKKSNSLKIFLYILGIAVLIACLVGLIILIPRCIQAIDDMLVTMEGINKLMIEAEASLEKADTALQNADSTLKSIDAIDFDSLNQAIRDFAKVIQPLANLFH